MEVPFYFLSFSAYDWSFSQQFSILICLQLERAEVRLEGIDTMLKLAAKSFLLPSVQYAMFCGWQRLVPEGSNLRYFSFVADFHVLHILCLMFS